MIALAFQNSTHRGPFLMQLSAVLGDPTTHPTLLTSGTNDGQGSLVVGQHFLLLVDIDGG
jgi:hypothetical protein